MVRYSPNMERNEITEEARKPSGAGNESNVTARLSAFVAFTIAMIALSLFTPLRSYLNVEGIRNFADSIGCWGPVFILASGILSPLLLLPRWPLAFLGGIMYGIVWGTLLATFASTLGAWLHFYMAGNMLAPVTRKALNKFRLSGMSIPRDKTFMALFFLRAFPLSNFVATNLLAGALRVHLWTYLLASFLGMLPSSLMYASWGKLVKKPSSSYYAVAVFSLLFIVVGTMVARKRFYPWLKQIREQRSGNDEQE